MPYRISRAILRTAVSLLAAAGLPAATVLASAPPLAGPAGHLNSWKPLPVSSSPATMTPPGTTPSGLPGETMVTAIPVTSLPFVATGNTCSYANDYAMMCPYGNWAPDVVYALAPAEETNIRIELCDSGYDTLIFLFQTDDDPYHLLACNDDFCGDDGYKSALERVHVVPGVTYYIVVDGYTSACGDYLLRVLDLGPCVPACTEVWEPEGEPVCGDDYHDQYDAGCSAFPYSFRTIEPSSHIIRICGTSGWYRLNGYPLTDEDWYQIQVEQPNLVDVFCQAEFDVSLWLLDAHYGCDQLITLDHDDGLWCENLAGVSAQLDPGRYWIVIEPESGSGGCGLSYRLWIDGYGPALTGIGEEAVVAEVQLQTPSPNPFHGTTLINYTLARAGDVRITIHDLSGRLVRTLARDSAPAGPGRIEWDGKDDVGRDVASGIYECRLTSPFGTDARPVIRVR